MQKEFITENSIETKKLGEMLADELRGGEIICMQGELGAGKTTFTQGMLSGLGVEGPYTSPTFLVMKQYHITRNTKHETRDTNHEARNTQHVAKKTNKKLLRDSCCVICNVYHIDAYRIESGDLLSLGWEEIISDTKNVIIIEWAERVREIIPDNAVWVNFEWLDLEKRKIMFRTK